MNLLYVISGLTFFASAAVAVDSSHMTASSSTSWSRFSPPSDFVSGHVLTVWFIFCHWPQSQESDWVRPHLCKLARHGALTCLVHQRQVLWPWSDSRRVVICQAKCSAEGQISQLSEAVCRLGQQLKSCECDRATLQDQLPRLHQQIACLQRKLTVADSTQHQLNEVLLYSSTAGQIY